MDSSQLLCLVVLSIVSFIFIKSYFTNEKSSKSAERSRRSNASESRSDEISDKPEGSVKLHTMIELRKMPMGELQTHNIQFGKITDRYWREIFRRQNNIHQPDHINVARLQTSNILTILDESLPHGAMHELTIIGLPSKTFSNRKSEVIRYLRDRLSSYPQYDILYQSNEVLSIVKTQS
ncbi:unnamed protein product [Caenorhabditis bovis]|uniref:Uncharacterized protein n=1 Tax=Caenorhabditis bovis TaxID=2654633 RepID=A0A8S1ENG3_9PELO|nr:unnamed protein product [Caenorhabditis bovis]